MKRKIIQLLYAGILLLAGLAVCSPLFLLLSGSVMDEWEIGQALGPVLQGGSGYVDWPVLPSYPTLAHYGRLLLGSPQFFVLFWNSVKMTLLILAGQLAVAVPAAWAFAMYPFPWKKILFTLYIVLMLMPFQVTMLPSYLVLNRMELVNTEWAVILPAVFSTFPVFLIYRGFSGIPESLLEAARIDGATEGRLLWSVGLPLGSPGILASLVLGFLEAWGMMEQPLAFLEDRMLWPLSLYLPEIGLEQAGYAFAASVITLIPAGFVFALGQDYLEQGIAMSGLKE